MQFRNLTPLHAMAFSSVDVPGNEFHVVVLKAGYRLEPTHSLDADADTHQCVLLAGNVAVPLVMADEYEGETGRSSVKWESDLAPFKPKCDVLVRATAHAPNGQSVPSWPVRLRVVAGAEMLIDKGMTVSGPRVFRKGWRGWRPADPESSAAVPVRWEYAFGGTSRVLAAPGATGVTAEHELNEVCFSNPLGRGWVEKRFFDRATSSSVVASSSIASVPGRQAKIIELPAPQIEAWDKPVEGPNVVEHPGSPIDPNQMKAVVASYGSTPVGLGVVGRAWTPRLQFAGTYDEVWRKERWPYLPRDFDFQYWNGAPPDQQIAWPKPGLVFELANLAPPERTRAGFLRASLPGHRALVALRFESGAIAPLAMNPDTLLIDTEEMRVYVTWRAIFPLQPAVRVCEARFELNPAAPLLQVQSEQVRIDAEDAWQTT